MCVVSVSGKNQRQIDGENQWIGIKNITSTEATKLIINLTQHVATPEQISAGVTDLPEHIRSELVQLLTFEDLPTLEQICARAEVIASLVHEPIGASMMIGGAPYLMAPLIESLQKRGYHAVFAFSKRESIDQPQPDGSVKKISVFKHAGFVEVN